MSEEHPANSGAGEETGPVPAAPSPVAPKPTVPSPAAVRRMVRPVAPAVASAPVPSSNAAAFGRVADDGTVFVRTATGERAVGSYPGASHDEALQYFARKYDELCATAELLHQRLAATDLSAKDAAEALTSLREQTSEPNVVGDLDALADTVTRIAGLVTELRASEDAERAQARAAALVTREKLVAEAERIAGQPESKVQWKSSSARMRALFDEWKDQQRSGPRLEKKAEDALWTRFSTARKTFDRTRRTHFAELEVNRDEARRAKEKLVGEAEKLAGSRDWGPTARAFSRLMDEWRHAGRASRDDDDALWERFRTAQDSFFHAKDEVTAAQDAQFRENLSVKEKLLVEAQALLPVTDLEAAKTALRTIQDKWEAAGKVPRGDMDRTEKAIRRVENAIRDAEDTRWKSSNPELSARANSLVTQLEASLASLRDDLATATERGNERKIADLTAKLEAQEQWLAQARAGLNEFGG